MAEAAPRHHRHRHAARRRERREHQRCFVANAAGAVFVDLDAGNVAEIDADARIDHRFGQPGGFFRGHAAKNNRHQERGGLVVGQCARGDPADEKADFGATERAAVSLFHNDVDRAHPARQYIGSER